MAERIRVSEQDDSTSLLIGDRRLTVHHGDLIQLAADALVCPVDPTLDVRAGLAKDIMEASGGAARDERPLLPEPMGKVVVLPGGELKAKYIFLSVLLGERDPEKMQSCIRQAVDRSIRYAEFLRLKTVAFPLLGSAANKPPFNFIARHMIEEATQYLTRRKTRLKLVLFSINNADAYKAFRREARSLASNK